MNREIVMIPLKGSKNRFFVISAAVVMIYWLAACAAQSTKPEDIIPPTPKFDNTGLYMCPYTQDGVLAEWVDMAINAKLGSAVGGGTSALAAQQATATVAGGQLGGMVGSSVGRSIAINACGGKDFIKATSDLSFNNLNDLAIYMYAVFSTHEHYDGALDATMAIYPELSHRYYNAIKMARKKR